MEIEGSVALVTGASRGIGQAFARALLSRGAAKVYAGVRRLEDVNEPVMEPLLLDVTNHQHIEAAAARASDASIVINNADPSTMATSTTSPSPVRCAEYSAAITPRASSIPPPPKSPMRLSGGTGRSPARPIGSRAPAIEM